MPSPRRVLVVSHTHERALAARAELEGRLVEHGLSALREEDLDTGPDGAVVLPEGVEVAVVLGGDGTILRAVELVRGTGVPVVGINLGHVGFLAELDESEIGDAVAQIARRDYTVEHRMTVDVLVRTADGTEHRTWAINEASVEKDRPERMIELAIGVDGRGLETFGCDGIVLATPTGSTAYAFSAGGPVVWPDVEALLLVPLSAHALFARPLVVGPDSVLEVELLERTGTWATMWCDGRRTVPVPPGSRVEVRRGAEPVALARLRPGPFTSRLVRKFALPVVGWRGSRP
ncbi:NAD kinase [Miniimonas arenae]|uniref:NAD kinase n=1 Tax=Miniimonas arenae TaxID=676201 RepID=UPI0028B022EC|nr:NAD kinase [Miniimonas arenae]